MENYIIDLTKKDWQNYATRCKLGTYLSSVKLNKRTEKKDEQPHYLVTFQKGKNSIVHLIFDNLGLISIPTDIEKIKNPEDDRYIVSENPKLALKYTLPFIDLMSEKFGEEYVRQAIDLRQEAEAYSTDREKSIKRKIENFERLLSTNRNRFNVTPPVYNYEKTGQRLKERLPELKAYKKYLSKVQDCLYANVNDSFSEQ